MYKSASTKHHRKKERERKILERFLASWNPGGRIIRDGLDDGSDPDFFVKIDGLEVGFEMTEVFKDSWGRGSAKKRKEREQYQICSSIADEYYRISSIPIRVFFFDYLSGERDQVENMARELWDLSRSLREWEPQRVVLKSGSKVSVFRVPDTGELERYQRWTVGKNHMGWSEEVNAPFFEAVVHKKSARLTKYKTRAEKVFLLIYCDRSNESGMIHLGDEGTFKEGLGFDGIFFFRHPQNEVFRLDVL